MYAVGFMRKLRELQTAESSLEQSSRHCLQALYAQSVALVRTNLQSNKHITRQ